ncbi:RagB/SusD family nutrient uptake outer membrane protein [Flavobacterium magnum]|nr:RagB/SusD family nutrient uptake outer membrane protein [Flavobacterium magnum]
MKKIFKFGFIALLFSVAACNDATDIVQESELDPISAYKTVGHLQSGLNGVYAAYGPDFGSNGNGDAIFFNDLFTDNMKKGSASSGQGSSEYNFVLQPSNSTPESIWANRYATINRVNRVLEAYNRIYDTFSDSDKADADVIKGQLLAMRALCTLDLFEYFTPDYTNTAGPSVIKMDFVPELFVNDTFPRNTVGEIVAFMKDDISQAYELLNGVTVQGNSMYYLNTNVIQAIEARLSLDTEDYARAEALATDLLTAFPLSDAATYAEMFAGVAAPTRGETIFALKRTANDNGIANNWYANTVTRDGSPILEASEQLLNLFDDGDVRKAVTFVPDDGPTGNGSDFDYPINNGIILIGKYPGIPADALVNDVKIFRASEMQLILAEAQARRGDLAAAAASVQAIRAARGASAGLSTYGSLGVALEDILLERRKEFAFEGHRYLDLKRLGGELNIGVSRRSDDAATFSAPTDLPANDYRFTLPIPQSELNANNLMVQNPGYDDN